MTSPIHVFYDGTHIDLTQIVEIGAVRVTESIEYRIGAETSDLRLWFEVVFKEVPYPHRYSYSLEDILGGEAVRQEVQRQYGLLRLDLRNAHVARFEADKTLLQEARALVEKHQNSLADAWVTFRDTPPAHDDPTIVKMLQALLDRQANGIEA